MFVLEEGNIHSLLNTVFGVWYFLNNVCCNF